MFCKKENAQGALEYLLMIGAAILVVAVVIIALSGLVMETKDQNTSQDYNNQLQDLRGLINNPNIEDTLVTHFSCLGTPKLNTVICSGDNLDLGEDTDITLVEGCTDDKKCEYVCSLEYKFDEGQCIEDTISVDCGDAEKTLVLIENKNYYLCTYKSNGSFIVNEDIEVELLMVAGGGGGGTDAGGGGGAGGLVYVPSLQLSSQSYEITVGSGGTGGCKNPRSGSGLPSTLPTSGENSMFGQLTAIGGGAGAYYCGNNAALGGSGGGGAPWFCTAVEGLGTQTSQSGDSGTYGYGNNGASTGGGGGAGGMGEADSKGGVGLYFPQFASVGGSPAGWFAGGGSGSASTSTVDGGGGRGGNWFDSLDPSAHGVANTGGGGGGGAGGNYGAYGGYGGSGIVIVKYPA